MTRPALAVLAVALALVGGCQTGATGAGPDAAQRDQETGRYTLAFDVDDVSGSFVVTANGFPLRRDGVMARSTGDELSVDLTPALVSGRNTAAVEVVPILARRGPGGRRLDAAPVRFSVEVFRGGAGGGAWVAGTAVPADSVAARFAAYVAGLEGRWAGWLAAEDSAYAADPSARAARRAALSDGDRYYGWGPALDSARAWAWAHPFRVATSFVRPGGAADGAPAFDGLLRDGPVIAGTPADSARLRAYAARLRDLAAAGDGAAYYDELAPAAAANAALLGVAVPPADSLRAAWDARAAEGRFPFVDDLVPFRAADVRLRSWAGGRVWELYRGAGDPLLASAWRGAERRQSGAFVAEVDGRLRVVRQ